MSRSVHVEDRSKLDQVARWVLRVEGAEPRALVSLKGSLVLSAVRCLVTYVAVPILLPLVGWLGDVATPLSLVLSVAAMALAVNNLRRVWVADWTGRWGYTAFSLVVLVVLGALVVLDVRALLA